MGEESHRPRRIVLVLLVAAVAVGVTAVFVRKLCLVPGALSAPTPWRRPQWHTPPDRWSRPREIYGALDPRYEERFRLQRERPVPQLVSQNYSANGGYWFSVREPRRAGEPRISEITIYSERDYVLTLTVKDAKSLKANWVNDKVIYAEIWWGRALGTYALIDVETESIIQAEMIQSGTNAYQQWQEHLSDVKGR